MTNATKILSFLQGLNLTSKLPPGIEILNPYQNKITFGLCKRFYEKYYNDSKSRIMILGINPGRFGAGLTGIPFTDPLKLEQECEIPNNFTKKRELSADFIYMMIEAFGGKEKFYQRFYFGSVCPLGFTKDGKNINYYDDTKLQQAVLPFIRKSIKTQLDMGMSNKVTYCLGEGKNYNFLRKLNEEEKYFDSIIPLYHPRFIMQYKRKRLNHYIKDYLAKLTQ